jgi:carbonic anhydrase
MMAFILYNHQLGDLSNPELRMLTDQLDKIRFGGDETPVRRISVRSLLPDTEHYMTYEGSTTSPACHETVTWIVLNKPIYITKQQVSRRQQQLTIKPKTPPISINKKRPETNKEKGAMVKGSSASTMILNFLWLADVIICY